MRLEDLLTDREFCEKVEAAKDTNAVIKLFAEKGIAVTSTQIAEAKAATANGEELNEEMLDAVSGGVMISWWLRWLLRRSRRSDENSNGDGSGGGFSSGGGAGGGSGGGGGRSW